MGRIEGKDYLDLPESLSAIIPAEYPASGQMSMRTGLVVMRFKVVRCLKYCPSQVIKGAPCSTGKSQHRPPHSQQRIRVVPVCVEYFPKHQSCGFMILPIEEHEPGIAEG